MSNGNQPDQQAAPSEGSKGGTETSGCATKNHTVTEPQGDFRTE